MEQPSRLTQQQACEYIGCNREYLKRLRRERKVRFFRLGHRTISYDRSSLDRFLKDRVHETLSGF